MMTRRSFFESLGCGALGGAAMLPFVNAPGCAPDGGELERVLSVVVWEDGDGMVTVSKELLCDLMPPRTFVYCEAWKQDEWREVVRMPGPDFIELLKDHHRRIGRALLYEVRVWPKLRAA